MNKEDRDELKEMLILHIKPVSDLLSEHHRTLFGNGTDGHQGLRVDVDRLKQEENRRTWHIRALWVAFLGGTAKVVFGWLK